MSEMSNEEALAHHGVKGMKWGVRKDSPLNAPHPSYTPRMRQNDKRQFGNRGVARINQHMNQGLNRDQAFAKEKTHVFRRNLAITGSVFALRVLAHQNVGGRLAHGIGTQAAANRGAATARNLMAESRGLSTLKVSKIARGGAHVITSLG